MMAKFGLEKVSAVSSKGFGETLAALGKKARSRFQVSIAMFDSKCIT
jgi:hypothetical protein